MKKLNLVLIMLFMSANVMAQLSEADKDFAIRYLNSTHDNIKTLVEGLSDESWNYKPEEGGWSVANCLEHILITEATFIGMIQGTVQQSEANPNLDLSINDGVLIGQFANRGTKVKTSPNFEPSGKWTTRKEMLDELAASRAKIIEYINNTDKDLRNYNVTLPVFEADTYQVLLLIAAHSQRHTFQMQEVLAEYQAM